ncbi:MAG: RNA methyltransferase [Bacteroidota bacterium]
MRKLRIEEMGRMSVEEFRATEKLPLVVVLDNVRSMHNVGSVFRTADAFCLEKIYLCGITPQPPHREIRKTAIGAEESVAWEAREDALALVKELKASGFQLLAIEQAEGSTSLMDFQASEEKYALILGHEIEGVQQAIIDEAHQCLEIPQYGTKHSLNISVAGGIALYDISTKIRGA